ncbi:MAG: hypothetical protein WAN72_03210 [Candidatus Acidiferrales bacterium]
MTDGNDAQGVQPAQPTPKEMQQKMKEQMASQQTARAASAGA